MRDTILTAVLTFVLLAAGTLAIGAELLRGRAPSSSTEAVILPTVVIVGHRAAAASPQIAVVTGASPARRVE